MSTLTLPERFIQLEDTVNGVVFERKREVRTAVVALLARRHHLQVGEPGIAKTMLVDVMVNLIDGIGNDGNYFRMLMTRFTTPEEIFGPPSLKGLEDDHYRIITKNRLPEARVAFVDEYFKGNSSILNAGLTILNEGLFFNDGVAVEVPLNTLFTASNELPREPELAAIWDRITFRHEVTRIKDSSNMRKMLLARLARTAVKLDPVVTWDDLLQAQSEADAVTIPDGIFDKLLELRVTLKNENVEPTDRRFSDCIPVIQANAWLNGNTEAEPEDLGILRHVLWVDINDQPTVDRAVLDIANPIDREAMDILATVDDLENQAREILKDRENESKMRQKGVEIHGKLQKCMDELKNLELKANSTAKRSELIAEGKVRVASIAKKMLKELFSYDDNDTPTATP